MRIEEMAEETPSEFQTSPSSFPFVDAVLARNT